MRQNPTSDREIEEPGESALEKELYAERVQLFKAMAIVDVCRFASDSFIAHPPSHETPDFDYALLAAYELIDACAGRLEEIGVPALRDRPPARRKRKKMTRARS